MNTVLNFHVILPILLVIIQSLILLFCTIAALRYFKLLRSPYAGMAYNKLIFVSVVIGSVFIIGTADIEGLFQATKTFDNVDAGFYSNTFYKFSQFFFVIFIFELLFFLICFVLIKIIPGIRNFINDEEDLPAGILLSVMVLGMALVLQLCAKEMIVYITPQYLNFR
jgi:hypothetical protein